ncbi:MAG: hypothetical protein II809_01065 [Bacteroidales bacterium]|nr:hypothetical protein [Bacteroidales bacterium]MBR0028770.1 hypothetical protein [Bacteroidales bacterium]MBR0083508.1 hypothetical protein [Bacteroidales bacterium]
MSNKIPYSTPSGYFDNLQSRLSTIPARRSRINPVPYLALAVSFTLLVLIGNYILTKSTASQPASDEAIIEYLIDSGTTLAQLEEVVYNY